MKIDSRAYWFGAAMMIVGVTLSHFVVSDWLAIALIPVAAWALVMGFRTKSAEKVGLEASKQQALQEIKNWTLSHPGEGAIFRPSEKGRPAYNALVSDGYLIMEGDHGYRLKPPPAAFRSFLNP